MIYFILISSWMLQRDAQFPLENKGSLKATWNIPLGWPPSKNLFAAQNNPPRGGREGGMKTWRESLIPDNNAIRINRRSRRRPGFEKNYSRGIRRSRRSFNRLLLTLSPCGRLSSLTSSWMESRATRVHSRCAKFRFSMPRDDPRNRCQFEENFPICI